VGYSAKNLEHQAFHIKTVEEDVGVPPLELRSERVNKPSPNLIKPREGTIMPPTEDISAGSGRRDGS
jgi:hypothetical protein